MTTSADLVQTVQYVLVELSPGITDYRDDYVPFTDLAEEWQELPQVWFDALLRLVTDGFECTSCARCGNHVGYGLAGDADERTEWTMTGLVAGPDGVISYQCEQCSPCAEVAS